MSTPWSNSEEASPAMQGNPRENTGGGKIINIRDQTEKDCLGHCTTMILQLWGHELPIERSS